MMRQTSNTNTKEKRFRTLIISSFWFFHYLLFMENGSAANDDNVGDENDEKLLNIFNVLLTHDFYLFFCLAAKHFYSCIWFRSTKQKKLMSTHWIVMSAKGYACLQLYVFGAIKMTSILSIISSMKTVAFMFTFWNEIRKMRASIFFDFLSPSGFFHASPKEHTQKIKYDISMFTATFDNWKIIFSSSRFAFVERWKRNKILLKRMLALH